MKLKIKLDKKIRIPLPKQACKVQTTNKKVYTRKNYKIEY